MTKCKKFYMIFFDNLPLSHTDGRITDRTVLSLAFWPLVFLKTPAGEVRCNKGADSQLSKLPRRRRPIHQNFPRESSTTFEAFSLQLPQKSPAGM